MKLDWNRYVPLGMDGKKVRNLFSLALDVGMGYSVRFLFRLVNARWDLYVWQGNRRVMPPGAVLPPFGELLDGSFVLLALAAACMPLAALGLYGYHYLEGRSIYTMRRLPNRRELWRRCLTLPVWTALACGLAALALTGLYALIYLAVKP